MKLKFSSDLNREAGYKERKVGSRDLLSCRHELVNYLETAVKVCRLDSVLPSGEEQ